MTHPHHDHLIRVEHHGSTRIETYRCCHCGRLAVRYRAAGRSGEWTPQGRLCGDALRRMA